MPAKTQADPLLSTLVKAGFKGDSLRTAWAIAKRESGGRAAAFNPDASTGDRSWGLFQINTLGKLASRVKQYGLQSERDLLNPDVNARVAYRMSQGGKDFGAWGIGPNAYRKMPALDTSGFPGAPPPEQMTRTTAGAAPPPSPAAQPLAQGPDIAGLRQQALLSLLAERRSGREDRSSTVGLLGQLSDAVNAPPPAPTPAAPTAPAGAPAPQTPAPVDTSKLVKLAPGADREGTTTHPQVLEFVSKVASLAQQPLTIGTGTRHNRNVRQGGVDTGRESDHWTGWAADIPAAGSELTRIGQDALIAAGADPAWARKQTGGVFNLGGKQILFNTMTGGNHFNHLHVGLREHP
jgi:hypothetical protein